MLCRAVGVSRSSYYAQQNRQPSNRQKENEELVVAIKKSHKESRKTYGGPRIARDLSEAGFKVGRNRVARLMRKEGITAHLGRKFRKTTDSAHSFPIAENLLDRNFEVDAPDKVWATDISYVRTWEGWMYLAVVIDLFSRRVVGWSMATHMRTELVHDALKMAIGLRHPGAGLLHHSDRGSQYASNDYRKALKDSGIICSMSRKGDCWDNSVVESFFGTLKTELIYRRPWPTIRSAKAAVAEYIEVFYNRKRRHSYLGYKNPAQFEIQFDMEAALAA